MPKAQKEHPHALALQEEALSYPEAQESSPWGHRVIKVRTKSFVFFGGDDETFSLSVKLPQSADAALTLPFAEPTGYGLGKSGWVSARFPAGKPLPLPILRAWIDESYRAIAPKKLVATLDGAPKVGPPKTTRPTGQAGAKEKRAAAAAGSSVSQPSRKTPSGRKSTTSAKTGSRPKENS